MVIYSITDSLW